MKKITILAFISIVGLSIFPKLSNAEIIPSSISAKAELKDANGKVIGHAVIVPAENGIKIGLDVSGLTEGNHAFHIHNVGACSDAEFKSAGPHFNPENKKHGAKNPEGHHMGDLPNLVVGPDGKGHIEVEVQGASFGEGSNSLFDTDGTSLVVHDKADDDVTDPAGNAGSRIACGVIVKS